MTINYVQFNNDKNEWALNSYPVKIDMDGKIWDSVESYVKEHGSKKQTLVKALIRKFSKPDMKQRLLNFPDNTVFITIPDVTLGKILTSVRWILKYGSCDNMPADVKNKITVKRKIETPKLSQHVCVKVSSLRKLSPPYDNLEEWMEGKNNIYVGRHGRIFITGKDGKKRVFVYKGSKWANPYKVKGDMTLKHSLELYRKHLDDKGLIKDIAELKGKNLGCFCANDQPCHAKILAQLANSSRDISDIKEAVVENVPEETKTMSYDISDMENNPRNIYTPEEILKKRQEVHIRIIKLGLWDDLTGLTEEKLQTLWELYDSVFFNSQVGRKLADTESVVKFKLSDTNSTKIDGWCKSVAGKTNFFFTISFPIKLFSELFPKKGPTEMITNGLKCITKLSCLQLVMEHEIMHMVMVLYKWENKKDTEKYKPHGSLFRKLTNVYFGHTDTQHDLASVVTGKRYMGGDFSVGDTVTFKAKKKGSTVTIYGKIIKMNPKRAKINELYPGKQIWNVSYYHLQPYNGDLPEGSRKDIKYNIGMVVKMKVRNEGVIYGKIEKVNQLSVSIRELYPEKDMLWTRVYYSNIEPYDGVVPIALKVAPTFSVGDKIIFDQGTRRGIVQKINLASMSVKETYPKSGMWSVKFTDAKKET